MMVGILDLIKQSEKRDRDLRSLTKDHNPEFEK